MESQEWFSHLIKTMDMLSKSFESRGETKFHALIPGQAQSLIFDGLVVEATLAREMAEEEKARLLAQPSLPTILRPAPLAYLGKHTARKTHSEYIWDWWDWFQKLNAAPATCSRCESGGLSKVVSQYLTIRLIQCCKNKSITNIKARQYLESRWCARCKGVDPFHLWTSFIDMLDFKISFRKVDLYLEAKSVERASFQSSVARYPSVNISVQSCTATHASLRQKRKPLRRGIQCQAFWLRPQV